MFALMVPVIVTGAWAERMCFKAFLLFVTVWPILVYYPLAHWVWAKDGWLAARGTMDFAGGITIHTSSGVAAFVVSLVLQRRKETDAPTQHNVPLAIVGGSLIWAGWYSFNGGSATQANGQAAVALLNTHLSCCTAAFLCKKGLLRVADTSRWRVVLNMNHVGRMAPKHVHRGDDR